MSAVLDIGKLTPAEKILIMEELWENLSQNDTEYDVPVWHSEELRMRERDLAEGKDAFVPWEDAKKYIREQKR